MLRLKFPVFLLLVYLISSCATTQELEHDEIEELLDYATEEMLREYEKGLTFDLSAYRNSLMDNYALLQNEVPASFRDVRNREERRNTNSGFRVQIHSTPSIEVADSIQREFIIWIDTLDVAPNTETYVTFRQPNYRVHVGDFLNRNEAIEFSHFVRQRFPNAWVVHDRINPEMINNGQTETNGNEEGNEEILEFADDSKENSNKEKDSENQKMIESQGVD